MRRLTEQYLDASLAARELAEEARKLNDSQLGKIKLDDRQIAESEKRIRDLAKQYDYSVEFKGPQPTEFEIQRAKSGAIDDVVTGEFLFPALGGRSQKLMHGALEITDRGFPPSFATRLRHRYSFSARGRCASFVIVVTLHL